MIIAIANQKGGVAKTTTAVHLGAGWALRGRRSLVIDLDSQGNVADSLGLESGSDLYTWLNPDRPGALDDVIIPSGRPALDVIRSDKHTAILKRILAGLDFGIYALSEGLGEAAGYDVILLDCAPSIDILHTAALLAADFLLIPTRLDQLAIKGVKDVLESLYTLQRTGRASCELAGILPTFYDRVTAESHQQLIHLAKAFGKKVLPPIPIDTQCRVASRHGQTLWEFAPTTRAIIGVNGNGIQTGGYAQVLDRLEEIL